MGIKEKKRVSTAGKFSRNLIYSITFSLIMSLNVTEEFWGGTALWKLEDPTFLMVWFSREDPAEHAL